MAPLILRPSSPAHGGAAIARDDGKVWLVNYALPGEVVEAEPRGRKGGVAVAATTRVIESSPHRVAAPCPYFGACGGCQMQHAAYAHQLELKRQVVEEAWARAGLRLPPDTAVLGMDDPWRYRIRGEFEAVPGAAGWRFGFHRLRSHSVLPIDSCVIHDSRIEGALPAFAQAATELNLAGLQNLLLTVEPTGGGLLWRLRFRGREPRWPRDELARRVAELLPDSTLLDEAMTLEFWDMSFRVRSDTFVQTNYQQMLVLYRTALDMLQPKSDERILDLYAGIGTSRGMRTGGACRADPARSRAPRLCQLRALDARAGPDRIGARRLPGQACRDRGHVSADVSRRVGGAARAKLASDAGRPRPTDPDSPANLRFASA